jgi:hypothetical protein
MGFGFRVRGMLTKDLTWGYYTTTPENRVIQIIQRSVCRKNSPVQLTVQRSVQHLQSVRSRMVISDLAQLIKVGQQGTLSM